MSTSHSPHAVAALAASLVGLMALCAAPARADSVAKVFNGQKIEGDAFADEAIRITLPMAQGTVGKLKLKLSGSSRPVSITTNDTQVFDPDGIPVEPVEDPDGDLVFGPTLPGPGKGTVTLRMKRLVATKTGDYLLVLRTNAKDRLRAKGKWKIKKRAKIRFEGDENSGDFEHHLQQGGEIRIKVKTGDGAAPRIEAFEVPDTTRFPPLHTYFNKKGAKTIWLRALTTGRHAFAIGYQKDGTAGSYKGVVRFKTQRSVTSAVLHRANAPGVDLSVFPNDRTLTIGFGDSGIGLVSPAPGLITITSEKGGKLYALRFTDRLDSILSETFPVEIAGPGDYLPAVDTVSGHRMAFVNGFHVVAFSNPAGDTCGLVKLTRTLGTVGRTLLVTQSATSTQDMFLTTDQAGTGLFLGLLRSPSGHTVRTLDLDFNVLGTQLIGAGTMAHRNGAAARWNPVVELFEVWAPDSLTPGAASDLNRQFYTRAWDGTLLVGKPVADPTEQETMSSALSVDAQSGVSIVHYVVVRNTNTGTGEIHRRLFDAAGDEVPGSHTVLSDAAGAPKAGLDRPASLLIGNYLYLGYETPTGPFVERFPLLR